MKYLFIFLMSILFSLESNAQCQMDKVFHELYFDDFNTFNTAEWFKEDRCQDGIKCAPDLVSVQNGRLHLKVRKDQTSNDCGSVWSVGSAASYYFYPRPGMTDGENYMLFEASIRMPKGVDVWPAFWLFSACNEIDIFEYYTDASSSHFTNTVHKYVCDSNDPKVSCHRTWKLSNLDEDFHTYAVAWRMRQDNSDIVDATFFFDGKELWTQSLYQLQSGAGMRVLIGNGMLPWSTADIPETDMEVEYFRFSEAFTKNIDDLKYEYFNYLNGNQACDPNPYSLAVGKDNQIFFNSGGWMHTYYYANNQWNLGYMTGFNINELAAGDLKVGIYNNVYYKGSDNKLHLYTYQNQWSHILVNNSLNLSPYAGSICTHHPDQEKPRIAASFRVNNKDLIYIYDGAGNNPTSIFPTASIAQECSGDMNFMGDEIFYRGKDGFLQRLYYDGQWKHAWILVNGLKVAVRTDPGSIITTPNDDMQLYIVSSLGWIYSVYKNNNTWNMAPLSTYFNPNEVVKSTSNIIFSYDSEPRVFFINNSGKLMYYVYDGSTAQGWIYDEVKNCDGSSPATPADNLHAGVRNLIFYRDDNSKIRNTFWRCCESLNACESQSVVFNREIIPEDVLSTDKDIRYLLSPNPANSVISIKSYANDSIKTIGIYDMNGRLIWHKSGGYKEEKIDIMKLDIGTYFVKIITSERIITEKFVKQL